MTCLSFRAAVAILLLSALPLHAETVTPNDVRAFAYAGDVQGLEDALDAMQTSALEGTVTPNQQRRAYAAFQTTHAEMHAFVAQWLKEMPASPHAHLAQGFIDQNIAWIIRGEKLARDTYPDAMQSFSDLTRNAAAHATAAYETDPRLIPASDLMMSMLRIGRVQGPVTRYLNPVMADRPNVRSLQYALDATHPGWGGTWWTVIGLCAWNAPILDDPDYDRQICMLDGALRGGHGTKKARRYMDVFKTSDSPYLEGWRAHDAIYFHPGDPEAKARALQAARNGAIDSMSIAETFDTHTGSWEETSMTRIVHERKRKTVADYLENDPYNPWLLAVYRVEVAGGLLENRPDRLDLIRNLQDALVFARYDADLWTELALAVERGFDMDKPMLPEPYYRNAVIYSNYAQTNLLEHLRFLETRVVLHDSLSGGQSKEYAFAQAEFDNSAFADFTQEDLICPYLRVAQVYLNVCEIKGDDGKPACGFGEVRQLVVDEAKRKAVHGDMCAWELSAEVDELWFGPELELPDPLYNYQ